MCRKQLIRLTWLTFLGLIYILGSADCYLKDEYLDDNYLEVVNYPAYDDVEDDEEKNQNDDNFENDLEIQKRDPAFMPFVSVGALSNIQRFFDNLKENFKNLEGVSHDERKYILGKQNFPIVAVTGNMPATRCPRKHSRHGETRIFRPPATAAFLHAVRNQKPPYRMKSTVAKSEASSPQGGISHYSPAFLRAKFGKKY